MKKEITIGLMIKVMKTLTVYYSHKNTACKNIQIYKTYTLLTMHKYVYYILYKCTIYIYISVIYQYKYRYNYVSFYIHIYIRTHCLFF